MPNGENHDIALDRMISEFDERTKGRVANIMADVARLSVEHQRKQLECAHDALFNWERTLELWLREYPDRAT